MTSKSFLCNATYSWETDQLGHKVADSAELKHKVAASACCSGLRIADIRCCTWRIILFVRGSKSGRAHVDLSNEGRIEQFV
jgi:hypothetical protein